MLVIPAIDILEGKCVRLRQGRFDESTVFYEDPAAVAKQWAQQGAQFLHVVDLEGARTGRPQAREHLRRIAGVGLPVQIGGGIRSVEDIQAALAAGATRVILGSRIVADAAFAKEIIQAFREKVVIGIDAREGMVAVHGWEQLTSRKATDLAQEMERLGAARIIFTDISRDGMLSGPNFESLAEMTAAVQIPVIASGGITRLEDIRRLKGASVEACILGRALYDGDMKLPEAIQTATTATDTNA